MKMLIQSGSGKGFSFMSSFPPAFGSSGGIECCHSPFLVCLSKCRPLPQKMGIAGPGTHSASAAAKKNDRKCLFDDFTFVSHINVSSGNWNFYGETYQQEVVY